MKALTSFLAIVLCASYFAGTAQTILNKAGSPSLHLSPSDPSFLADSPIIKKNVNKATVQSGAITTFSLTAPPPGTYNLYSDSLALIDLYNSTNGAQWTNKTNWLSGKISTWYGVTIVNNRVAKLVLNGNNLVGTIPQSIGDLRALNWLYLYSNNLSGGIPTSIGNLTALTQLFLHANPNLGGGIPSSIGNLTSLNYMYIYRCQLTGSIPSSIGNLTNLISLYIHDNNLSGDLPSTFGSLTNLQFLAFSLNNLSGNFDWLGNLKALHEFWFYGNPNLNCTIPATIGGLTNLTSFVGGGFLGDRLYQQQQLHGEIPSSLGSCTKLVLLYLDNSQLTGTAPTSLHSLVNLTAFSLFNNFNLSGDLNSLLGSTHLQYVYTYNTKIGGSMPAFTGYTSLIGLDMSKTSTTGQLPNLTSATGFQWLGIDSLAGVQIPSWLVGKSSLWYVSAKNTGATTIPNFSTNTNKANLELYVQNNNLDFGSLEPLFTSNGVAPYKVFNYSPQSDIGITQTLTWAGGTTNSMSVTTSGSYNQYQWQKLVSGNWQNIAGATATTFSLPYVYVTDSGRYRLAITNQRVTGLTLHSKVIKVQVSGSVPPAPSITEAPICANQTASLSATGQHIKWYKDQAATLPRAVGNNFVTPVLQADTTYYVVQEVAGFFSTPLAVTITVNPLPIVTPSQSTAICFGQSTIISVSGNASTYSWDNGLGLGQSFSLSPTVSTTYTITGTSDKGCVASAQTTVTVNSLPVAAISPTSTIICAGTVPNLVASGGVGYLWSDGGTNSSFSTSLNSSTTVGVVVTDINGCIASASAVVTVNAIPVVTPSLSQPICKGQTTTVSVDGDAVSYTWDNGLGQGVSFDVSPFSTTTYLVTGTASNGCISSGLVTITVRNPPLISISPNAPQLCLGLSTNLTASGGASYHWSNGISGSTISVSPTITTTYTVSASDNFGCTGSKDVIVQVDPDCPVPPTDLRVASLTPTQIKLTWTNVSTNQTGLQIERSTAGGGFQSIATVANNATAYTDTNLQPSTTYAYRLKSLKNGTISSPTEREEDETFSSDQNYVKEILIRKDGVTDINSVSSLAVNERIITWNYMDGEGRGLQQVTQQYSPTQKDVVQPVAYDQLGRTPVQYLPYTVSSQSPGAMRLQALGDGNEQQSFYNGTDTPLGVPVESTNPFSQISYEDSPLSRALKGSAPGQPWNLANGKTVNTSYGNNTAYGVDKDYVLFWRIVGTDNGINIQANSYYDAGELSKIVQTDEQGAQSVSFIDKLGRTIMSRSAIGTGWASTYYIYDESGNLAYQLPPLAIKKTESQQGDFQKIVDQDLLNSSCYQYLYDNLNRKIIVKAPGTDPVYFVYDQWNRLVLSQDGNQRLSNQWTFKKYDSWNRPIIIGLTTDTRSSTSIQAALTTETVRFEIRNDAIGNQNGYTNQTFPTKVDEVLSVSYYDDYSFIATQIENNLYVYKGSALTGLPGVNSIRTLGIVTGTKNKIIGTEQWLWTVPYFDDNQNMIQVVTGNHLDGIDRASSLYDFTGRITISKLIHFEGDNTRQVTMNKRFTFDHVGRPLRTYHQLNSLPEVLLSEFHYNELGQVISKGIHSLDGSSFLQNNTYSYNIRGWLTNIAASGQSTTFNEDLAYDNSLGHGSTARFDGLVNATQWTDDLTTRERQYNFSYDDLGRMQAANFKQTDNGTEITGLTDLYSEKNITYDFNGNIQTLDRYASAGVFDNIELIGKTDRLVYTYQTDGNQLTSVTDNSLDDIKSQGVNDLNKTAIDYIYDVNGNLIQDKNKGITVTYNQLNLTDQVSFTDGSYIKYIYDASGTKRTCLHFDSNTSTLKRTDYIGIFVYEDNKLVRVQHPEGYVSIPDNEYFYFVTDHLGSPRVVLQTVNNTHSTTATMETSNVATEQSEYLYYNEAIKINYDLFNKTPGATTSYSTRLNGTTLERTGLAKSLSVMPGDVVNMEVFVKYLDTDNTKWSTALAAFMTSIANATAPAGTFIDGGAPGSTGGAAVPFIGELDKSGDQGIGPKAYLNWLVFDRNFKHLDGGYVHMTDAPKEDGSNLPNGVPHERLSTSLTIQQAGYVYVWISNENDTPIEVYFDDFKVDHIESAVVQINGYYPFGLTAYSYVRENQEFVNYLFQDKQYDSLTQWHDFGARQYDAALGRWFATDPHHQFVSPYVGMGNNPFNGVDPTGMDFWDDLRSAPKRFGDFWGDETHYFDQWTRETHFYEKVGIVAAVVVVSILTDGLADEFLAPALEAEDGLALSEGTAATISGAASGTVSGAASGLIVGRYEGHSGNELWDDIKVGAVTGFVGGAAGGAVEGPIGKLTDNKILQESLKGGATGFAGGFAHGFSVGISRHYSLKSDFKLGLTEGIIGGAVGLTAGAAEGTLKSNDKFNERFADLSKRLGFRRAYNYITGNGALGNHFGRAINAGYFDGNISGKLSGGFLEGASDDVVGDKYPTYKNFNHFLWGSVFDGDN